MPRKIADRVERYFSNFEELEADILRRIELTGEGQNDNFPVMTGIAILYLSWVGFKVEDIPFVRKSDLVHSTCEVLDTRFGSMRPIPESGFRFLTEYAAMPVVADQEDLSPFLVRNRKTRRITIEGIHSAIKTLNMKLDCGDKNYSIFAIYESGIFFRVYANQTTLPVHNHGKRLTRESLREYERIFERQFKSTQALTNYLSRYHTFVKRFYSE